QLTFQFDRMRMTIQPKGRDKVEYDTRSTDEPQGFAALVAPMLREMTRAKYKATMSQRGKISDVKVPDSLVTALAAAPGAGAMGDMASAKGLEDLIARMSFELPETLDAGQSVTTIAEVTTAALGKLTLTMTHRYVGQRTVEGVAYEAFEPKAEMAFANDASGV